jgi:Ca-activated chloride channel homolog
VVIQFCISTDKSVWPATDAHCHNLSFLKRKLSLFFPFFVIVPDFTEQHEERHPKEIVYSMRTGDGKMGNEKIDRKRIAPDPGNTLFVLYVGFVMCILFLALVVDGYAGVDHGESGEVSLSEIRQGALLFSVAAAGKFIAAPRLSQDVEIYISAMIARTTVRQRFVNGTDQWQEAIYVFPLPDESAVDQLRMKIGERIIEGELKEKEEAKKVYEQAKKEGKKASLLAQQRPNIFTMAVANIAPGEEIEVEIEFQQVVALSDGVFSLRFPMVVGPRYIPGTPLMQEREQGALQFSGTGWAMDTDQVPDASRITPPVAMDGAEDLNPVRLMVELAAGFSVARVESLYHGITVDGEQGGVKLIRFDGTVQADRDFVLEWEADKRDRPQAALFSENRGSDAYLLMMLTPPARDLTRNSSPRELVFVLDTSGSMAGPSIVQAREALILAISRLTEHDRFNVIEFNSNARKLFDLAQTGDAEHRKQAIRFVSSLKANGGTEIAKALDLALDGRKDHQRIRQVMFLTDGSVGNEKELLGMIGSRLGDSRLFTVGIGSAPNSYFMSRAAVMGRGSYTYIGKTSEVQQKMMQLFQKLEHPAITDIMVETGTGQPLQYYPNPIPDLYAGEPLVVALKIPKGIGEEVLQISGRLGENVWQEQVNVQKLAERPGIATLWARKKIRSLMDSLALGESEEHVRNKVLSTALSHHLVSRYTSLVAVEKQVARPLGEELHKAALKNNLPQGWQAQKIFGGTAQTATPAQLRMVMGLVLLLAASLLLFWNRRGRV